MTDRTHITVLLDRTGSMQSIRADVVGGFNAFVDTHKAAPGEATLTLVQFDSQDPYEMLYAAMPIQDVPALTLAQYVPRASTPLYDAMGRAIAALDAKLEATPAGWRPQKVIFVVVTDGQENASVQFSREQVMALVDAKKNAGWDFVFLSADLGALQDAQAMGVHATASLHFGKSAKGSRQAWASVAEKSVLRRAGARSVAFDAADRDAQEDAK
jgi:FtsP/CotA-like multicopper oxidase with cupredoxin domain